MTEGWTVRQDDTIRAVLFFVRNNETHGTEGEGDRQAELKAMTIAWNQDIHTDGKQRKSIMGRYANDMGYMNKRQTNMRCCRKNNRRFETEQNVGRDGSAERYLHQ